MEKDDNRIITLKQTEKLDNFVIFQTDAGKININVFFYDETLWLTQKLIAELFDKGRTTILEHADFISVFNS